MHPHPLLKISGSTLTQNPSPTLGEGFYMRSVLASRPLFFLEVGEKGVFGI
jgi:hypothetical protein